MSSDINITFSALNSYYLNTATMRINADYLNDAIILWGENTERFYKAYTKTKKKIRTIVWEIFLDLANQHIKDSEYPHNQDLEASSYQLKKWLERYGDGLDTLKPAVDTLVRF